MRLHVLVLGPHFIQSGSGSCLTTVVARVPLLPQRLLASWSEIVAQLPGNCWPAGRRILLIRCSAADTASPPAVLPTPVCRHQGAPRPLHQELVRGHALRCAALRHAALCRGHARRLQWVHWLLACFLNSPLVQSFGSLFPPFAAASAPTSTSSRETGRSCELRSEGPQKEVTATAWSDSREAAMGFFGL